MHCDSGRHYNDFNPHQKFPWTQRVGIVVRYIEPRQYSLCTLEDSQVSGSHLNHHQKNLKSETHVGVIKAVRLNRKILEPTPTISTMYLLIFLL
ncbi:unnamed protein product, partial [Allacma fusca]